MPAETERGAVCAEIPRKTEPKRGFGEWPVGFLASPLLRPAAEGSSVFVLCGSVTPRTKRSFERPFEEKVWDWEEEILCESERAEAPDAMLDLIVGEGKCVEGVSDPV